ncbi:MAG: hypothetical protein COB04_11040 [Gammaproteobacteria bacterium]|nr:MAG: hypothetical protein COB04_11040 [Gammaproteobacteria bacterium]
MKELNASSPIAEFDYQVNNSDDISELAQKLKISDFQYQEFQLEKACCEAENRWPLLKDLSKHVVRIPSV